MPDLCISFWSTDWKTDMMLKVTDICSTDPSNPAACKKPGDIKIDRTKAKIWSGQGNDPRPAIEIPGLDGDSFERETVWYFRKCWDDVSWALFYNTYPHILIGHKGMLQEGYDHEGNNYAIPKFYNNLEQSAAYNTDQYYVNQAVYPANRRYKNCQTNP